MKSERSLASSESDTDAPSDGSATRRQDTRDALLEAALEGFSTNGYQGTSIRDLARMVGIRESSVYRHFASKQAIFDALIELADARLSGVGSQWGLQTSNAPEAAEIYRGISEELVSSLALKMFDFVIHDPVFSRLRRLMMIEQYREPEVAQRLNEYLISGPLQFQAKIFGELMKDADFDHPSSPEQVALAFYGPIFLLMQMGERDEVRATALLSGHIANFRRMYLKEE